MEITYVKRKDLNVEKYDACIEQSIQSRIYAFSWYLDIVADHWDVLVSGDYEAVMPIPWTRKFGFKYVVQPPFCQQLGVFSLKKFTTRNELIFLRKLKRKFLKIHYAFNSKNLVDSKLSQRINYTILLNSDYNDLFKGFNKGRKHAVKKGIKNELTIGKVSIEKLLDIQSNNYNYQGLDSSILKKITNQSLNNNIGFFKGVFLGEELLGGAFLIQTKQSILYLFSAFTTKGKKLQAPSFIIYKLLEEYSNSDLIFDFEGGNLPNIATFFKSFGAKKEYFYQLRRF